MKVFRVFPEFRVFKPLFKVNYIYKCIQKICKGDIFRIYIWMPLSSMIHPEVVTNC